MVVDVPQSAVNAMQEKDPNTRAVVEDFVAFIQQVINCHKNNLKKLDKNVMAAKRFLECQDFTAEMLKKTECRGSPSQVPV